MADTARPIPPAPNDRDGGSSLVPMLIWGLVLITVSMIGVMLLF